MKKFFLLFLAFVIVFVFAGCAKKTVTAPVTQEMPKETTAPVTTEKKAEPMKTEETTKAAPQKTETVPVKEAAKESAEAKSLFNNILFDFDKYNIREDAKPVLKSAADWMMKNKNAKMTLEGHADERGTNEYNLALGEKRAKSARDYLVSLGVAKKRLDTLTYGEEKPLCTEQNEDCWQKNRRVQFVTGK